MDPDIKPCLGPIRWALRPRLKKKVGRDPGPPNASRQRGWCYPSSPPLLHLQLHLQLHLPELSTTHPLSISSVETLDPLGFSVSLAPLPPPLLLLLLPANRLSISLRSSSNSNEATTLAFVWKRPSTTSPRNRGSIPGSLLASTVWAELASNRASVPASSPSMAVPSAKLFLLVHLAFSWLFRVRF